MQFITVIMFSTGQMLWLRFMSEYMDKTLYKIADYTGLANSSIQGITVIKLG